MNIVFDFEEKLVAKVKFLAKSGVPKEDIEEQLSEYAAEIVYGYLDNNQSDIGIEDIVEKIVGFTVFEMDEIDNELKYLTPTEILELDTDDFDLGNDYFYYDESYGRLVSGYDYDDFIEYDDVAENVVSGGTYYNSITEALHEIYEGIIDDLDSYMVSPWDDDIDKVHDMIVMSKDEFFDSYNYLEEDSNAELNYQRTKENILVKLFGEETATEYWNRIANDGGLSEVEEQSLGIKNVPKEDCKLTPADETENYDVSIA